MTDYESLEGEDNEVTAEGLALKSTKKPAISGARPTSGKHFSRHMDDQTLSKYIHNATQPPLAMLKAMTFQDG